MNKCILITSHLNDGIKVDVALNLVESLKNKGLPIVFVGNYPIPIEIQEIVDYTFNIKENPKINRTVFAWYKIPDDVGLGENLKRFTTVDDYGYAHLHQTNLGFKIAKSLGYDYVIHLNYDITIDDSNWSLLINEISEFNNLVLPWGSKSKDEFATNFYCFKSTDFINMCDEFLHFYKNVNPKDIKKGWYCETFFKWMLEKSKTPYTLLNDISISSKISNISSINFKYGQIMVYVYENNNSLVIIGNDIPNDRDIYFGFEDGQEVKLSPTNHNMYYTLPLMKGKFYSDDKLLFDYERIKHNTITIS